ncbi:LysM peptidoglycan-binding domain-containing M23 family metallopeptidase [uncultured Treponema sp.]|uniref:LysM peptidoglycan-binding domain-containing M23 family metallopeptidase n=1 Tax=uncultured Treponema sp. TaxID=162155 RepID=UPI002592AFBA|nr:LysM peptidoglycan-binding domain-containing M23 family metallopeptidase [uncultured Treponema sp.]
MKSVFFKNVKTAIFFTGVSVFCSGFLSAELTHTVQKGETLYSISKKYSTTVQSIADANKIDGTDIKIGQKLVIPEKNGAVQAKTNDSALKNDSKVDSKTEKNIQTYTVKKGDTWYAIARNFSVSVKQLYELNGTDEKSGLKVGQKIKIPAVSALASNQSVKNTETSKNTALESKNSELKNQLPSVIIDTHNYSEKKGDPNLVWPVQKPEVTYVNGKVSGVTLSAKKDEPVDAIKSGTVMFSGTYRGFGNVVFIQSKTGHIYAYTGLGKVLVSKGDYIDFKTQIGTAGINSYSSKSQISLMVFQNGLPIDPAKAPRG